MSQKTTCEGKFMKIDSIPLKQYKNGPNVGLNVRSITTNTIMSML
jgi:hypothetical protein